MKKIYSNPELYLVKLEAADIVYTSPIDQGEGTGPGEAEARRRGASIWGDE